MAPPAVLSIRENFTSAMGRRARALALSDAQKRVILSRVSEFRAALRRGRLSDSRMAVRARYRGAAVQELPSELVRTN